MAKFKNFFFLFRKVHSTFLIRIKLQWQKTQTTTALSVLARKHNEQFDELKMNTLNRLRSYIGWEYLNKNESFGLWMTMVHKWHPLFFGFSNPTFRNFVWVASNSWHPLHADVINERYSTPLGIVSCIHNALAYYNKKILYVSILVPFSCQFPKLSFPDFNDWTLIFVNYFL